jgi:hypothetical protein
LACGLCSETFECGGALGCWCLEVRVTSTHGRSIKSRTSDCVCRRCLEDGPVVSIRP